MDLYIRIFLFIYFFVALTTAQSIYDIKYERNKKIEIPSLNSDFQFSTISLKKVDTLENFQNKVLLRRKFDIQQYSYYEGVVKTEYFKNLDRFIPEKSIKNLLTKKFYKRVNDNPENDILNVYFFENSIYIENHSKIFYYENGWNKIENYREDSAPVSFLSYPDSVSVFIDGINYGLTPLVLKEITPGVKVVTFKKSNYYCYDFLINKTVDIPLLKRIIMHEMPETPEGTFIDPETYSHGSNESINLLVDILNNYHKEYEIINEKIRVSKDNYLNKYPKLEIQTEFEDEITFQRRKEIYLEIRDAGLSNLNNEEISELYSIEKKVLTLTTYLEKLKRREYCRFFNTDRLEIGLYDSYKEKFPVKIKVNEAGHNFCMNGEIFIPYSKAERFKNDYVNSLIKVTYISRINIDETVNENLLNYEYSNLSILYKGCEYRILGEIEIVNDNKLEQTVLKDD